MINQPTTQKMLNEWHSIWLQYKDKLKPNRKPGEDVLQYLQNNYILTEVHESDALDCIIDNITMNNFNAEKLPSKTDPNPRAFFLENIENGKILYKDKDTSDIWNTEITKIFVGIDIVTGFFMVEGSTMLFDELCAFRGLDEKDIENYACVAEYISCLKRFGLLKNVIPS